MQQWSIILFSRNGKTENAYFSNCSFHIVLRFLLTFSKVYKRSFWPLCSTVYWLLVGTKCVYKVKCLTARIYNESTYEKGHEYIWYQFVSFMTYNSNIKRDINLASRSFYSAVINKSINISRNISVLRRAHVAWYVGSCVWKHIKEVVT